jgi:hypothetical protein
MSDIHTSDVSIDIYITFILSTFTQAHSDVYVPLLLSCTHKHYYCAHTAVQQIHQEVPFAYQSAQQPLSSVPVAVNTRGSVYKACERCESE